MEALNIKSTEKEIREELDKVQARSQVRRLSFYDVETSIHIWNKYKDEFNSHFDEWEHVNHAGRPHTGNHNHAEETICTINQDGEIKIERVNCMRVYKNGNWGGFYELRTPYKSEYDNKANRPDLGYTKTRKRENNLSYCL